jgi:hypothetical protein
VLEVENKMFILQMVACSREFLSECRMGSFYISQRHKHADSKIRAQSSKDHRNN